MSAAASNARWMGIERSARQLSEAGRRQRQAARKQASADRRSVAAGWVARHLGEQAVTDTFAVDAALEIRDVTGRMPSPQEVERFAALWLSDGHRVALGWLLHATGCRVSDRRRFVRWAA